MALSPLARRLGVTAGRIMPSAVPAVLGSYVFVLGSDLPGDFEKIVSGDSLVLSQTADITGLKFVRFRARVRAQADAPPYYYVDDADGSEGSSSLTWQFWWGIGATRHGERTLTPGRTLDLRDGAIDVSQLSGNQTFKFVLEVG